MHTTSFLLGLAAAFAASSTLSAQSDPVGQFGLPARDQQAWQVGAKQAQLSSTAWLTFAKEQGAEWISQWCPATGTPRAIYGPGLALADWRENTQAEARRHAAAVLAERAALLGLGKSEFREAIASRIGRQWSFVYDQYFGGLPVLGGRADVRIHMLGRLSMFGASAWQIPEQFDVTPAIDDQVATAVAWNALGTAPNGVPQPAVVASPRLVIWGDIDAPSLAPYFLAWEIPISNVARDGSGPIGRFYVDARTARVLRYVSDKHECGLTGCTGEKAHVARAAAMPVNTTVTVMGWTRVGIDGYAAATNVPLPGLELSVPGIGTVVTDNNGQFTINISSAVTISYGQLNGRHHGVVAGTSSPSGTLTVQPGVNATLQMLTSSATVAQASHPTVSYWVDKSNEYARSILGNSAELATADAVVPTVNITSTCNAYYTSNTINFYSAGGGCSNTANATVIAHEWGHGLDAQYGGISQTNGLSEGWGDIIGMYLVDSPSLGLGFSTAGVPLRSGNNTTQYPCSGCGVHTAGQSWMGFAWKLRDRLATSLGNRATAIAVTNDIIVSTVAANATDQQGAVLEVFLADDDDGNLSNGTPHVADLTWACNQHSLPVPTGGGGGAPVNDACANAIVVQNGVNGSYTNVNATTSSAWPCANGGKDVWFAYTAGAPGTLTVTTCSQATWDTAVEVFSGTCASMTSLGCNDDACSTQSTVTVTVAAGPHLIRVGGYNSATGTFSLDISGPTLVPASTAPYGAGCYTQSAAYYELFASSAFDLSGGALTMTTAAGGYAVGGFGAYVAPTAAATSLALTDDSQATVNLSGTFFYRGGTTTSLVVCSNGYVSVASGNGTAYTPSAATWLSSLQPRWGTWHDFNPAASGSGAVKFEEVGTVAYVTWDGVYSYSTTTPNTFQLQFDRSTGRVTMVWQNIVASGNGWLVGYANTGPNNDLGSKDLSATLPSGFFVGGNSTAMAATSTLPQIGTNCVFTATNYPGNATLGLQVLSFIEYDPGIDLAAIGMPGCQRYTDLDAVNVVPVIGGQSSYNFTIPNSTTYMGLGIKSQAWGFASGYNALGIVNSNGLRLVIGT